jgi:hypothetical protein
LADDRDEFCAGFEECKIVKHMVIVPVVPFADNANWLNALQKGIGRNNCGTLAHGRFTAGCS